MNKSPTTPSMPVTGSEEKTSLLTFPCDFTIKVFGVLSDEFEKAVLDIIHKNILPSSNDKIELRKNINGKYCSLSIAIRAESQTQLDAIYHALSSSPLVLMAL